MEEKKIQLKQEDIDYLIRKIRYLVYKSNDYDEVSEEVRKLFIPIKHSNSEKIGKDLEPFDIQKAKQGKPVCTRDGRKARIICFDRKGDYPIIALVEDMYGIEYVKYYTEKGTYVNYDDNKTSKNLLDLMMLPEKKEGWVNVYKESIYNTKEEAIKVIYDGMTYIDTVKVCWEE